MNWNKYEEDKSYGNSGIQEITMQQIAHIHEI